MKDEQEFAFQMLFIGLAVEAKVLAIVGWLLFLHSTVPLLLQLAFFVFVICVPLFFYRVSYTDPGYIYINHKANICAFWFNQDIFYPVRQCN